MITREQVEARLRGLREQYEQTIANANALMGACQDCEHWLAVLDTPEGESPSLPPLPFEPEPEREEGAP